MKSDPFFRLLQLVELLTKAILTFTFLMVAMVIFYLYDPTFNFFQAKESNKTQSLEKVEIEDGIHRDTGLKAGQGLELVIHNCTSCHSAKLITQNRATKEGWQSMIKWMQATQNLWDLGENEQEIIEYLSTNYAPENKGRRENLTDIEWYELED